MGRKYSFEVNRTSTAPCGGLFAREADGPRWAEWGKPLIIQASWARQGTDEPNGVGAVRAVGLWPVLIKEETVEYEQDRRRRLHVLREQPDQGLPGRGVLHPDRRRRHAPALDRLVHRARARQRPDPGHAA